MIIYNPPQLKNARKNLRINSTEAERKFWQHLKNKALGEKFYRQFGIEHFIVDFYCWRKKLIIEIDGNVHNEPEIAKQDRHRQVFLENKGFKILRFKNEEILQNIYRVIDEVRKFL